MRNRGIHSRGMSQSNSTHLGGSSAQALCLRFGFLAFLPWARCRSCRHEKDRNLAAANDLLRDAAEYQAPNPARPARCHRDQLDKLSANCLENNGVSVW